MSLPYLLHHKQCVLQDGKKKPLNLHNYHYHNADLLLWYQWNNLLEHDRGVEKRNEIAKKYKQAFQGRVKFQELPQKFYNAHHLFVIEVESRKGLYEFLKEHHIFTQIHYIPVHTLPYYKEIGYETADLSNAENYYSKCISLPMYPTLKHKEQKFVIDKVLEYLNV